MEPPDFSSAEIPEKKLSGYLLSSDNSTKRANASFFMAYRFTVAAPEALGAALHDHALSCPVDVAIVTRFGTKYVIEGPMQTPSGRQVSVRSVWFLETGQTRVRFVTAYPA